MRRGGEPWGEIRTRCSLSSFMALSAPAFLLAFLGWPTSKKDPKRLERTVSSQDGQGRLSVNSNGHVISKFESSSYNHQCILESYFGLILNYEWVCEACQVFTDDHFPPWHQHWGTGRVCQAWSPFWTWGFLWGEWVYLDPNPRGDFQSYQDYHCFHQLSQLSSIKFCLHYSQYQKYPIPTMSI